MADLDISVSRRRLKAVCTTSSTIAWWVTIQIAERSRLIRPGTHFEVPVLVPFNPHANTQNSSPWRTKWHEKYPSEVYDWKKMILQISNNKGLSIHCVQYTHTLYLWPEHGHNWTPIIWRICSVCHISFIKLIDCCNGMTTLGILSTKPQARWVCWCNFLELLLE